MKKSYFSGFFYISDSANKLVVKRKYRGFLWYIIPFLLGGFFTGVLFNSEEFLYGLGALLVFYIGLCGIFNVITISIDRDFIEKRTSIFPVLFGSEKIPMKDFASASLSADYSKTGKRVYNTTKGFYDETSLSGYNLVVSLNTDTRTNRITLCSFKVGDTASGEFLISKMEHFATTQQEVKV